MPKYLYLSQMAFLYSELVWYIAGRRMSSIVVEHGTQAGKGKGDWRNVLNNADFHKATSDVGALFNTGNRLETLPGTSSEGTLLNTE